MFSCGLKNKCLSVEIDDPSGLVNGLSPIQVDKHHPHQSKSCTTSDVFMHKLAFSGEDDISKLSHGLLPYNYEEIIHKLFVGKLSPVGGQTMV